MKASTGVGKSTHYLAELYKLVKHNGYKIICSQLTIQNTVGTADYMSKNYGWRLGEEIGY